MEKCFLSTDHPSSLMVLWWSLVPVHFGRYIGCVVVTVVTTTTPSTPPPQTPTEFVDVIWCPVLQTDISYWRQNCKYLSIQQDAFVRSRQNKAILFVFFVNLICHRYVSPWSYTDAWKICAYRCQLCGMWLQAPARYHCQSFPNQTLSKYLLTSNYFFGVGSSLWRWSALPNFCNRATCLFIVHPPPTQRIWKSLGFCSSCPLRACLFTLGPNSSFSLHLFHLALLTVTSLFRKPSIEQIESSGSLCQTVNH